MKVEWERFPKATHFTKTALGSCDYWQVEGGKILRQWVQLGTGGDFGEVPREHIRETPFRMPVMHERASAVWDGEGRPRAGVLIEMKHKDATGPAEVADVLSHMLTLCEDLADAKTKQQKALWAIDAKVVMNKGFALINGMVVEQHQLKAEVERIGTRLCMCRDCGGQGEIYSGHSTSQGYNQPPEPDMDVCGTCGGDGVLGPVEDFEALATERDQIKAEAEALRKDAERYRWFRENSLRVVHASPICWVQRLDEAIDRDRRNNDAAMTKGDV